MWKSWRGHSVLQTPTSWKKNKDTIVGVIGADHWDTYSQNFKQIDTMHITVSQHNRLLQAAENEEELESFGISSRPIYCPLIPKVDYD